MNVITNILFSVYLYFFLKLENIYLYLMVIGIIFPYLESLFIIFLKNKSKFKNKIFHSVVILGFISLILALIITLKFNKSFFFSFLFLSIGNFIHLFSDLTKSKDLYLLYPFKNKKNNFSISNYFDIIPSIILIISNFLMILFENKLNLFERLIPLLILGLYFFSRFMIKKVILKIILKNMDEKYDIIIAPTLKINIWNVIRVAKNNIYLFNLDIIKGKYLFVKYFTNNISDDDIKKIAKSENFKTFKKNHKYLYYQSYSFKKDVKVLQVFDVKNFFNLFKREQVYYEVKYKNDKMIKEKVVL